MPIALSTFAKQTDWEGCTWSVPSKQQLAKAVAMVAVGQAMHLAKILHYESPRFPRRLFGLSQTTTSVP